MRRHTDPERAGLLARLFDCGEVDLYDEGIARLDAPMGVWDDFACRAESALTRAVAEIEAALRGVSCEVAL